MGILLACAAAQATAVDPPAPDLSADQIVERNVAARGGRAAWQAIRSMSWRGSMEAGSGDSLARSQRFAQAAASAGGHKLMAEAAAQAGNAKPNPVLLPFTLTLARPHKSRLELQFAGRTALQVFDGVHGWKLRPFLNREEIEPFSDSERQAALRASGLEGPLIDHAAEGTQVALEGVEPVDGRNAYRLRLTAQDGSVRHVWIDAHSFLDVKIDGNPRQMDGHLHAVAIFQRDFRQVRGVMLPFQLDTVVEGYREVHHMTLDQVALDPPLDDLAFARPRIPQ